MDRKESACDCDLCRQARPQPQTASDKSESRPPGKPRYPAPPQPPGRLIPRL